MKNKIKIFASIILLTSIAISCNFSNNKKPSSSEALKFNDALVKEQKMVQTEFDILEEIVEEYNTDASLAQIENAIKLAHIALSNIDELDDFQGGEEYRQATIDFINNYIELAKNEYTEFIEKYYLPDELFTDEILDRCLEILMDIDEKYNASFDKLTEIQEEFAKLYHFDLEVRK